MQVKAIAVSVVVMLVVVSSGCLLLHPTRFTLLSGVVGDSNGFPVLNATFNLTGDATVSLTNPARQTCYSEEFLQSGSISASLGEFRLNPAGGAYILSVKDTGHNTIFSRTFSWSAPALVVQSCNQQWFSHGNETVLLLSLEVRNSGQLPFYPHSVQVLFGSTIVTGPVDPRAVLPGGSAMIHGMVVMPTQLSLKRMTVQLLGSDAVVAGSLSINVTSETCPSLLFSWYYQGRYQVSLPNVSWLYSYEKSLPREASEDYALYVFNSLDDVFLTYVLHRILSLKDIHDSVDRINFIASFVQSLTYREDSVTNASYEYPRYPIETLNEQGGDCEDKAILCAELLCHAGYNVTLIRLPDHMALGVHVSSVPHYTAFANGYYFLESTAEYSPVGRVPDEFLSVTNYTLFPLSSRPLIVHEWMNATRFRSNSEDVVQLVVLVKNLGSVRTDVQVNAFFEGLSMRYNSQSVVLSDVGAGDEVITRLEVKVPTGVVTVLKTQVLVNGVVQQEKESATQFE